MGNKLEAQFQIVECIRASPTDFGDLESCKLKFLLKKSRQLPLLPSTPNARLGNVHHKLQEYAFEKPQSNEKDLENAWEYFCSKEEKKMLEDGLEKRFVPLIDNIDFFNIIKKLSIKQAMSTDKIKSFLKTSNALSIVGSEKTLESKDKLVYGKADRIIKKDGGFEILDFKTGEILDPSTKDVKEGYKVQVKLYAALFFESEGIWPKKLSICGYGDKVYYISFTENECTDLLLKLKRRFKETNELVRNGAKEESLGNPNPEICKYCTYRPLCKRYWASKETGDGWPRDVRGKLVESIKDPMGKFRVVILSNGKRCTIRKVDGSQNPFIESKHEDVAFFNLKKEGIGEDYSATILTEGYYYS